MTDILRLRKNDEAIVIGIKGGKEFSSRMASMGLTVGTRIKVLQNYGKGPIIVLVRDTRIALGRGEAQKVIIGARDE